MNDGALYLQKLLSTPETGDVDAESAAELLGCRDMEEFQQQKVLPMDPERRKPGVNAD